jgi:hypothetical protein
MVSLVAEIEQGPADMNCRAAVRSCSAQDGAVVEFSKPGLLQDGDGADDRTGWPAVIRGRREQDRSKRSGSTRKCSSQYQQCGCQRFLGKGVGCGRACREVRQWGSKPEQTQDGRRGWLPESGAVTGHGAVRITSSAQ